MLRGSRYNLAVPHLALLYKIFGHLYVIQANGKTTYELWSIVVGWLGVYFYKSMDRTD